MWEVHEGRPSWHQQRAGHISAAVTTGFRDRAEAEQFAQRLRDNHPGLYVFVRESTAGTDTTDKPKRRT